MNINVLKKLFIIHSQIYVRAKRKNLIYGTTSTHLWDHVVQWIGCWTQDQRVWGSAGHV